MDELRKRVYDATIAKLKKSVSDQKGLIRQNPETGRRSVVISGRPAQAIRTQQAKTTRRLDELEKVPFLSPFISQPRGVLRSSKSFITSKDPILSREGLKQYGDIMKYGAGSFLTYYGAGKMAAQPIIQTGKQILGGTAVGGVLGAGFSPKGQRLEGAKRGATAYLNMAPTLGGTTPAIQGLSNKLAGLRGGANTLAGDLIGRTGAGIGNVVEGFELSRQLGRPIAEGAGFDFVAGFAAGKPGAPNAKGLQGVRNMEPDDMDMLQQANEILKNKKNFTLEQINDAKKVVYNAAEAFLSKKERPVEPNTTAIINTLFKKYKEIPRYDSGVVLGIKGADDVTDPLTQEARKYKSAEEFYLRMSDKVRDELRNSGIRGREAIDDYWNKNAKQFVSEPVLDTLNPTGSLFANYDPKSRMTMKLGKNITTYDKTAGLKPDEIVTIYRGASKNHKKINPGDFITTSRELAESYSGDKNVLELKVKAKDILDDITEPLGDEYIYRPQSQLTDIWNKAQGTQAAPRGPMMGFAPTSSLTDDVAKERGFIKNVKSSKIATKQVKEGLSGTYTPITNKQTIEDAQFNIKTEGWDASKKRVLNEPFTPETNAMGQLLVKQAQKEGRYDDAIEIIESLSRKGTQAGQTVQAFSIWSKLTPEGMLKYAKNQIDTANQQMGYATKLARKTFGQQAPELTKEDARIITELMQKSQRAATEADQAAYAHQALDYIGKKLPWGVSDIIDEYRYNNMLSGPLTHLRNLYSNVLQTYFVRPATLVAEGKPLEAVKYEAKALQSIPNAFSAAVDTFKHGKRLGRLDDVLGAGASSYKPKRLGKLYNIPSDLLEASDTFFTTLIKNGEMARGMDEANANKAAQYWVFRQALKPDQQGALLNSIDNMTGAIFQLRKVGLGWAIPFLQTPMNIAKQGIEFSPAGLLTTIGAKNQREQLAKAGLGSIAMVVGANLAMQDKTTWDVPTDAKAKELFYASGKKPYSVLIGDKWVPLQYFGPFAWAMGLPAANKHYQEESRTALSDGDIEKIARTMASGLKFWSQQTFVQGLGQFVKMAEGDYDYNTPRIISNFATQLNPMASLQRYVSQILDPVYRRPRGDSFGEKIVQNLQAGIPGQTQKLEAYTNPLGEESKRNITALTMPWGLGIPDERFEGALDERTKTLQNNAVKNKIKKEIEQGAYKGDTSFEADDVISYFDPATGKESEYDLSFLKKEPVGGVAIAKQEAKKFDTAVKAYRDEDLPEELRADIINRLGVSSDDVAYYDLATEESSIKNIAIQEEISQIQSTSKDRGEMLRMLAEYRREVSGERVLSDTMISDLVSEDILSKEEGKILKNLKYDSKTGKVKVKTSGRGGGAKLKNVKFVPLDIPFKNTLSSIQVPEGLRIPQGQFSTPQIKVANVTPIQQPKFQVKFNL